MTAHKSTRSRPSRTASPETERSLLKPRPCRNVGVGFRFRSNSDLGTGTFHVLGNTVNSGGATWADNPGGTNVALPGGYVVKVKLSDISFVGDAARGGDPETVSATFTLVSGPAGSVPEPATMLILSAGLVGLGAARRRARR